MAHLIPDFAFALLPVIIVAFQSLYDNDIINAHNINKIDVAVPLMILSGTSFGKSTAVMGCAYAIGRAICTSSKDGSVIEAGQNFMTFILVLLIVSSALAAYNLLTRKPRHFREE